MRKKLIIKLGILGLAAIFLLSMASYSTDQEVTTQGKPDKPGKPGKPTNVEWIQFTGDLEGGQPVVGCCPNAGPFPEYTMTLTKDVGHIPAGTYNGNLFTKSFSADRGKKSDRQQQYKVQFWWTGETGDNECGIEIRGGVIDFNEWNRVLTVTFTDVLCEDFCTGQPLTELTFTLVRHPYDLPPTQRAEDRR
jgi:hypothetical protein